MTSRLQAKTFFLTYPQTTFTFDDHYHVFIDFLKNLGPISYSCVGIEKHADGTDHFHCLVDFEQKLKILPRSFDFQERHPNIQCVGKTKADYTRVRNYVKKDGNYREEGKPKFSPKESVWSKVTRVGTEEEALALISKEDPRQFILNRRNIDYALSKLFSRPSETPYQGRRLEEFKSNESLDNWRTSSFVYESLSC